MGVLWERDPNDEKLWVTTKADRAGVSEVVNDLNGGLVNFWRVLQDVDEFKAFSRRVQALPLSRQEFETATEFLENLPNDPSPVFWAIAFFVACRQSRAGTFKGFTSLTRSRTRRGINGNASEWLSAVEGLPQVHDRLRTRSSTLIPLTFMKLACPRMPMPTR